MIAEQSDARNKNLMKMLNLLGTGERRLRNASDPVNRGG